MPNGFFKIFVVFALLVLFVVRGDEAGDVKISGSFPKEHVPEVMNNDEINYDKECNERFKVKEMKKRVNELENDVKKAGAKEEELKKLQQENSKLKGDVSKKQEAEGEKVKKIEKSYEELKAEYEAYKTRLHRAVFNRVLEKGSEFVDNVRAKVFPYRRALSMIRIDYEKVDALMAPVVDSFNSIREAGKAFYITHGFPALNEFASSFGFDKDLTLENVFSEGYNTVEKKFNELVALGSQRLSDGRNRAISALKSNVTSERTAEDVVDLTLYAMAFLLTILMIQPTVFLFKALVIFGANLFVSIVYGVLKSPWYLVKWTLYVLTFGWFRMCRRSRKVSNLNNMKKKVD